MAMLDNKAHTAARRIRTEVEDNFIIIIMVADGSVGVVITNVALVDVKDA